MTYLREANDVLKLTTPRQSPRKKKKFSGGFRGVSALESEVTESAEFHAERIYGITYHMAKWHVRVSKQSCKQANRLIVVRLFIGTQKQISGPPLCPNSRLTERRTTVRAV